MSIAVLMWLVAFYSSVSLNVDSDTSARVRPADLLAHRALQIGMTKSTSFRMLTNRLQHSNLIVYIRTTIRLPRGIDAQLQFATARGGSDICMSSRAPATRWKGSRRFLATS